MPFRDYGAFRDLAGRDYFLRDDHNNPGGFKVVWDGGGCEVVAFTLSKDEARRLRRLLGEAVGEGDEGSNG